MQIKSFFADYHSCTSKMYTEIRNWRSILRCHKLITLNECCTHLPTQRFICAMEFYSNASWLKKKKKEFQSFPTKTRMSQTT